MKNSILLFLICLCSVTATAQLADTLTHQRKAFNTALFLANDTLSNKAIKEKFKLDNKVLRKYYLSKGMLYSSPFLVAAGTYLAVDALVGIDRTAIIDGVEYDYVERSLPKLLLGLSIFVTGGAFMEGSNDLMVSAAKKYNAKLKKQATSPKTAYQPKIGITPQGNVGFRIDF